MRYLSITPPNFSQGMNFSQYSTLPSAFVQLAYNQIVQIALWNVMDSLFISPILYIAIQSHFLNHHFLARLAECHCQNDLVLFWYFKYLGQCLFLDRSHYTAAQTHLIGSQHNALSSYARFHSISQADRLITQGDNISCRTLPNFRPPPILQVASPCQGGKNLGVLFPVAGKDIFQRLSIARRGRKTRQVNQLHQRF